MFGCSCNFLPVASIPVSPTSVGSSNTAIYFNSHQFISISPAAFPHHLQATSIVKLLNSIRGARNLCQSERSHFKTGLLELQLASSRKNPSTVSLMVSPVAERDGKVFVNREKLSISDTVSDGHARTTICEKAVFLGNCSNLLALEEGELHEVEEGASPACPEDDLESSDSIITNKEKLRRERISRKNNGKVPWNKGKKHSPETIELIRQRTSQAMLQPAVREKLIRNASKPMGEAIKENIKRSLLNLYAARRKIKFYQLACLQDWKNQISEAARVGGAAEEELQWNSYSGLSIRLRLEYIKELRAFNKMKKQGFQESAGFSKDRRKSISDAIKEKWKDPVSHNSTVLFFSPEGSLDYRTRACMGRQNHLLARSSKPHSEKKIKMKRSKLIDHMSTNKLACEKQQSGHQLSARVNGQQAAQTADIAFVTEVMRGEEALLISSKKPVGVNGHLDKALGSSAENYADVDKLLLVPEKTISDEQYGKLLACGNSIGPFGSDAQDFKPEIRKVCSYVDSKVSEKLEKLQRLRASRLVMEMKKMEAAERARMLMLEAEKAAKALEAAAKSNKFAKASLVETRRLLAEAAQSIKTVESKRLNEQEPMQHQKTKSYAIESSEASTSSLPEPIKGCMPHQTENHQSVKDNAEVELKMNLASHERGNTFDLIDSWIIYESPNKVRTSPPASMKKFYNLRKHSVVQPGLRTTGQTTLSLTDVDNESFTFTRHHQNLEYCSSTLPIGNPAKHNRVDINWSIPNQPKGSKKWHCGRLITVEN
ncbi:hypothetical protein O6H91_17G004400 [Diphasiastrum complanatum]|uniref:Uncharacterized protein n=1 Tax=Diphasiastrum complanatum TaxID=34168 RepID=A0ACC2B3S9_DIPCM|nr:hypothetical protein O6H91_17G004400 [Diphasiastrum complanatum]